MPVIVGLKLGFILQQCKKNADTGPGGRADSG